MSLTYEQFKEIVPKRTFEFVLKVLPYLDYYNGPHALCFKCGYIAFEKDKIPLLLLYCLSKTKEYSSFLKHCGFIESEYEIDDSKIKLIESKEKVFEEHSSIFDIYEDETLYVSLQPLDIVVNAFFKYQYNELEKVFKNIFSCIFPNLSFESFFEKLVQKQQEENIQQEYQIEQHAYGELSSSVISYLETASKIRGLLFTTFKAKEEFVKLRDEDIVPVSLLLAIYFYKDNNIFKEACVITTEQNFIRSILSKKGIELDKILNLIGLRFDNCVIENTLPNKEAILLLYTKFYRGIKFQNIDEKDVSVSQILENVFINTIDSYAIKKIFANFHCDIKDFVTLEESVKSLKELWEQEQTYSMIQTFYKDLPEKTIDFLEYAAKIYILLQGKKESNIIKTEENMNVLSLFISAFYYSENIKEFVQNVGMTLENILNLLHLSITKEEIEAIKLDRKLLVIHFGKFVHAIKNKSKKEILVDDVIYNLCDKEINQNIIMETIFLKIASSTNLYQSFSEQLKNYLDEKEAKRQQTLKEQWFHNMPEKVIEYLENVSKIHQYITNNKKEYSENDIRFFSLLLSLYVPPKGEITEFLESKGITLEKICASLMITFEICLERKVNFDILNEQYSALIFEGYNKGLDRQELTVFNIVKNMFLKNFHNSTRIETFLDQFALTFEDFNNLEDKIADYQKEKEIAKKREHGLLLLSKINEGTTLLYMFNTVKIYQRISDVVLENRTIKRELSQIDRIELSILLGIFSIKNNAINFFEKHQITLKNICATVGLNPNILVDIDSDSKDNQFIVDIFGDFINNERIEETETVSNFISKYFAYNVGKQSHIVEEIISAIGVDYDIVKREIIMQKDYELLLSREERLQLLLQDQVELLDITDMDSILHFGDALSFHSKYIHDELPRLMLSDVHDKSVETINQIINHVYIQVPAVSTKKSFLKHLFIEEETKSVLNPEAIQELKKAIDDNIKILSQELLGYNFIRRYIEMYCKKNHSYFLIAKTEVEKLEQEIANLNSEKEEEYAEFLKVNSFLQIMKDKQNRFSTSNILMKQELFKVNQAIVNHFITINALEMARDDLLPLIGSELALMKGREREKQALELSKNVIGLFQSILSRNSEATVENMELLKKLGNLSSETLTILNKDVEAYLKGLEQVTEEVEEKKDVSAQKKKTKKLNF